MARSFVPDLKPRLFIEEKRGAREIVLERALVRLDLDPRRVTVLWHGRGSLAKDEVEGRAVLALERADELLTYRDLALQTRNLEARSIQQR